jgi:hypothetical protein
MRSTKSTDGPGKLLVPHRKHVRAYTTCYGYSFTLSYGDDVRSSQEHAYGPPRSVTEMTLLCYMWMMFIPHRKLTYGPPRSVTEIALLFKMQIMFVPHRKLTYNPPLPVTEIDLLFKMQMMFIPHTEHTYGPPRPGTGVASPSCLTGVNLVRTQGPDRKARAEMLW